MKLLDSYISKNFKCSEIACNDADATILVNEAVLAHLEKMQKFREVYGRPIAPSSWYRTAEHNSAVGGVSTSRHLEGIATDFPLPSEFYSLSTEGKSDFIHNVALMWRRLFNFRSGAIGVYDTFIHLDSRDYLYSFDLRNNKNYTLVIPSEDRGFK